MITVPINDSTEIDTLNPANMRILEDYLNKHVFGDKQYKLPKKQIALLFLAGIIGATWGIPWRAAAADAAVIFPKGLAREIFEKIFSAGIVITVGGDGVWVMLEIGKALSSKSPEERTLTFKERGKCFKISKVAFPALFALFACISSVYATVKYNKGSEKFLGIITFIVTYAYSSYGYSKFFELFFNNTCGTKNSSSKEIEAKRAELIENINYIITSSDDINLKEMDGKQLLSILQNRLQQKPKTEHKGINYLRLAFQTLFAATIPIAASTVSIYLTKGFFEKDIYDNKVFDYTFAFLSEIPGFMVAVISTGAVFGKLFNLLFCRPQSDPQNFMVKKLFPISNRLVSALVFILALTAPSAGAFITYNTLDEAKLAKDLLYTATAAIIAARITFSNFTLNGLFDSLFLELYRITHSASDELNIKQRLIYFSNLLEKANPTFFQPLLSDTNSNNKGKDEIEPENIKTPLLQRSKRSRICCGIM